ncbi:MAG: exo-beta-N-acetylmuramidase NamZ domain-containing protein [Chloroflexota bacterium]
MRFGIDRLIDDDFAPLRDQRIGLFTNLSAVNRDLATTYDVFRQADRVNLTALFSPEHGLAGAVADGVAVASDVDPRTGLTVHSLYGTSYRPTHEMLTGLDVIVCDIQDIGVRYYTFLWTLTHILEACGEFNVPVMVLDRPNPLGGHIDGGSLDLSLASLVGRYPIPVQHGMTLGELALLINDTWNPAPALITVVTCDGWSRQQTWDEIGRTFVPPSPNMPRYVTALHYPGACLIEGTTLSEGRGTPLPFEVVGAPYIDAWALADAINALPLHGFRARPHQFTPTASKYSGQLCGGIHLHVVDTRTYRPLVTWLAILGLIRHMYPDQFAWLPVHQPDGLQHFDRLIGSAETRTLIDRGEALTDLTVGWNDVRHAFVELRRPYLLYAE